LETELQIRFANISDLPSMVNIYNQAIRAKNATGDTEELNAEDRVKWFEKYDKNEYPLYVVEIGEKIVGYCSLSPYRQRRKAMSSIAEISYYLDFSMQRKGIGTALLNHVILDCNRIGKKCLLAIILDINFQSVGILKKFNFVKWGHFPDVININGKKCSQLIYGLKLD
jgi:L-amino acid N-acyltransferase YncA